MPNLSTSQKRNYTGKLETLTAVISGRELTTLADVYELFVLPKRSVLMQIVVSVNSVFTTGDVNLTVGARANNTTNNPAPIGGLNAIALDTVGTAASGDATITYSSLERVITLTPTGTGLGNNVINTPSGELTIVAVFSRPDYKSTNYLTSYVDGSPTGS